MKTFTKISCLFLFALLSFGGQNVTSQESNTNEYTLIIEGYDWGPGVNKVLVSLDAFAKEINATGFSVEVKRSAEGVEMRPQEIEGTRKVVHAYISDEKGKLISEGNHATLMLALMIP